MANGGGGGDGDGVTVSTRSRYSATRQSAVGSRQWNGMESPSGGRVAGEARRARQRNRKTSVAGSRRLAVVGRGAARFLRGWRWPRRARRERVQTRRAPTSDQHRTQPSTKMSAQRPPCTLRVGQLGRPLLAGLRAYGPTPTCTCTSTYTSFYSSAAGCGRGSGHVQLRTAALRCAAPRRNLSVLQSYDARPYKNEGKSHFSTVIFSLFFPTHSIDYRQNT